MTIKARLEEMLIDKGLAVDLLWGVQGQWRKTCMDVMRWEANCRRDDGTFVHVGSWHTMTECVRRGFTLQEDGPPWELMAEANSKQENHGSPKAQGIRQVR